MVKFFGERCYIPSLEYEGCGVGLALYYSASSLSDCALEHLYLVIPYDVEKIPAWRYPITVPLQYSSAFV